MLIASAPFGNCVHRQGLQDPILDAGREETGGEIRECSFSEAVGGLAWELMEQGCG